MKKFKDFLTEMASSIEDEALGHLTHVKDIPHEDPSYSHYAVDLLHDFHNHRKGRTPKGFGASIKHDGGASVIVKHDERGVAVTDKHRAKRGVEARTHADIKQHFGHAPGYAEALKHLLAHGKDFVAPGKIVQGDLLYTPKDKAAKIRKGKVEYTPNRITYKAKTDAPIGLAAHTEYTNGIAHAISPESIGKSSKVFIPHYDYSRPDPSTYHPSNQEGAEHHIAQARALLKQHTSEHLSPEHIANITIYNNRTARAGGVPTSDGYMDHLAFERERAARKLKTDKGKDRIRSGYNTLIKQVFDNKEHFDRSLAIRHHMEQATEHLLSGIDHPDLETRIDGKKSPGEGVVLHKKDQNGLMRPVGKLVPKKVQYELGNNKRFVRPPLK